MNQITSSPWYNNVLNMLNTACVFIGNAMRFLLDFFSTLPSLVRIVLLVVFSFAVANILLSFIAAVIYNADNWKAKPGSHLMFSYFCGSGEHQRKLIYHSAYLSLWDEYWSVFSLAGLACRLGNYRHPFKLLMFACSLLFIPLAVLGYLEMVFRYGIGTVCLFAASLVHRLLLLVLRWITYIAIPLWRLIDKLMRVSQNCTHCYQAFTLPKFVCPHCSTVHYPLIPSRCGIFYARCKCGRFIPCAEISGRSNLDALCPNSTCNKDLPAANAKQLSIQLIGGDSAGKTAFLAAFQHIHTRSLLHRKTLFVTGKPFKAFKNLENMYKEGTTVPSSVDKIKAYHFVHRTERVISDDLIIYDIPDEVILSGDYQKNPLNFGFSDGIIIIIDPLSIVSVREECQAAVGSKAVQGYSHDDPESIIIRFINQFSEIIGLSVQKMSSIPVAVLINKTDLKVVKRNIGFPLIQTLYNKNRNAYQNDFWVACNEICRAYLNSLGLSNALNNLDSVFSKVSCYPVSAIGHISEDGKPFEPFGIMEPIIWIAKQAKSRLYQALLFSVGNKQNQSR